MHSLDLSILYFLNQTLASPGADVFAELFTNVRYWFAVYVLGGLFLIYKYEWSGVRMVVGAILLLALTDSIGHYVIKPMVARQRPCALTPDGAHVVSWIRLPTGMKWTESFPSNHALNNFAVATFFVLLFPRKKSVRWLYLVAALVSIGRVYEGVHYPSDVLGGAAIGVAIGWLWWHLFKRVERALHSQPSASFESGQAS